MRSLTLWEGPPPDTDAGLGHRSLTPPAQAARLAEPEGRNWARHVLNPQRTACSPSGSSPALHRGVSQTGTEALRTLYPPPPELRTLYPPPPELRLLAGSSAARGFPPWVSFGTAHQPVSEVQTRLVLRDKTITRVAELRPGPRPSGLSLLPTHGHPSARDVGHGAQATHEGWRMDGRGDSPRPPQPAFVTPAVTLHVSHCYGLNVMSLQSRTAYGLLLCSPRSGESGNYCPQVRRVVHTARAR